jgi:hypothetical protein
MSCPLPPPDLLAVRCRLLEGPPYGRRRGPDHDYTVAEWAAFLRALDAGEHGDRPAPEPAATCTQAERVRLLAERRKAGRGLWSGGDRLPPGAMRAG